MVLKQYNFCNNQLTRPPGRNEEKMSRQHVEVTSRRSAYWSSRQSRIDLRPCCSVYQQSKATVCLATRFPPRLFTDNAYHRVPIKTWFRSAASHPIATDTWSSRRPFDLSEEIFTRESRGLIGEYHIEIRLTVFRRVIAIRRDDNL